MILTVLKEKTKNKALDSALKRSIRVPRAVCYGLKKELGRQGKRQEGEEGGEEEEGIKGIYYLQERERARLEEMEVNTRISSS